EGIEVDRRQPRLDGLELLLARLADGRRGLRRNGDYRIAVRAHADQDVPRLALAIAEWHVATHVAGLHHGLAMLAERLAAIAFEKDLHDLGSHRCTLMNQAPGSMK